jgi:hypothetical protein
MTVESAKCSGMVLVNTIVKGERGEWLIDGMEWKPVEILLVTFEGCVFLCVSDPWPASGYARSPALVPSQQLQVLLLDDEGNKSLHRAF